MMRKLLTALVLVASLSLLAFQLSDGDQPETNFNGVNLVPFSSVRTSTTWDVNTFTTSVKITDIRVVFTQTVPPATNPTGRSVYYYMLVLRNDLVVMSHSFYDGGNANSAGNVLGLSASRGILLTNGIQFGAGDKLSLRMIHSGGSSGSTDDATWFVSGRVSDF